MTLDSLIGFVGKLFGKGKTFALAHKRVSAVVALIILIFLGVSLFGGGNANEVTAVATPKHFVQHVSVSGKVKSPEDVQMSFEETGRVDYVYATVGETVTKGAPLIGISSGTLAAQLASARAEVALRRAERENSLANLSEVRRQQNVNVESAYRTLLSDGLEAEAALNAYTAQTPLITGAYKGTAEGQYKIIIKERHSGSTEYELRVFGIETSVTEEVSNTAPTAIGTKGLYISFPDELSAYEDTTWYVSVPNTKSSSYLANFNEYQQTLKARDKAVADAEAELVARAAGTTVKDAQLAAAEAEVNRILAELAKFTLRAPFDGVVTAVDVEIGEAVSVNDSAVSIISANALEIESFVPEINIAFLQTGDRAVVTLDAYGESVPFEASVVAIDPAETIRDGVSTYRVRLAFATDDERIKSGMTANILITTDEREGVIAVPQGIVVNKQGQSFVPVKKGNKTELVPVVTGTVSSLGEIEIISGLSEGDIIVISGS